MKTTVEKLSPTRAKLLIEVNPEELKPSISHAYRHIAEQVTVPGFRKGKVPPPIIDQRIGRQAVLEHAVNDGINEFFRKAVNDNKLRPLTSPEADIDQWPDAKDFSGDLKLTIEVDVRPEITLPDFGDLTLTVDPIEVSDDDVTEELDRLRSRFGTLVPADRPATKGDFAQIDLSAKIGDEEIDTASGVSYEIGSGELIDGLDEALDSLSAGESTTFTSTLLGGEHEGEEAEVSVTLTSVKERELPAADDDFAQVASEFDTIAELREDLKAKVFEARELQRGQDARTKLIDAILEKIDVPVPQKMIDDEVQRHLENEDRLEDDQHRAEVAEASEKAFRAQLLLDEVVEAESVQVGQDELTQFLIQSAAQYGMSPNDFVKTLTDTNQIPAVVGEVARNKALAVMLGKVKVVDTAGTDVDMEKFVVTLDSAPDTVSVPIDPVLTVPETAETNDGVDNGAEQTEPAE